MFLQLLKSTIHFGLWLAVILFISALAASLMEMAQGLQKVVAQFTLTLDAT